VREHTKSHPPRHDGDALSALLATELALREQFETARAEAEKIVADARLRAKTTESSARARHA
jgi:vacuolar-type H+-ATPase subunit H